MDAEVVVKPVQAGGDVGGTDVDPTEQSGDAVADEAVPEDMSGWTRNRRRKHLKKMRKNRSKNWSRVSFGAFVYVQNVLNNQK